ncbi:hypothetical protein C7S16_7275 [Burkholderia thailandensis]|uniref:Uncharacterized protein n=1 Tax=Burkholderia thailandensis TaxID=57975 RepID=A0AAW9CRQ3_BURTH|nr:hypothetical protein [Burkholderia thailandensis]MDW9252531.1 hypothetical protein [Burkholderia thailandensis]
MGSVRDAPRGGEAGVGRRRIRPAGPAADGRSPVRRAWRRLEAGGMRTATGGERSRGRPREGGRAVARATTRPRYERMALAA